jgi:hypothetical protein
MAGNVQQSASVASIEAGSPFVQLRWDQIQAPYFLILDGAFDVETLQAFCAGIRWAFDQYHAYSFRFPGRLENGAQACIEATDQVLKIVSARKRAIDGDPAALAKVVKALERHLRRFQQEVKNSRRRSQKLVRSSKRKSRI